MSEIYYAGMIATCFAASAFLCFLAIKSGVLKDGVTQRSSHLQEASRAGGVAIMVASLAFAALLLRMDGSTNSTGAFWLIGLSSGATLLGLADDVWSLKPRLKFAGQVVLAILAVFLIGQIRSLPLPFIGDVSLGIVGSIITVLWIVAFMNVFNFMDGLNGIAAGAAVVALSAMAIVSLDNGQADVWILCVCSIAGVAGFLVFNVSGKIFMGDAGSHGIGFFMAVLAVLASAPSAQNGLIVDVIFLPIILLPFIFDVTLTLVRRVMHRQPLHKAHKEHIYQRLHQSGLGHLGVATIYSALCFVSALTAIIVLRVSPSMQWLGPFMLVCFFGAGTLAIRNWSVEIGSGRSGD